MGVDGRRLAGRNSLEPQKYRLTRTAIRITRRLCRSHRTPHVSLPPPNAVDHAVAVPGGYNWEDKGRASQERPVFRISVRDLQWMMVVVGMGVGWWLESRARIDAAEDARMLAHFSANGSGCSQAAFWRRARERKDGADRFDLMSVEAIDTPKETRSDIDD